MTYGQENRAVEEPQTPGGPDSYTKVTLPQPSRSETDSDSEADTQKGNKEEEEEKEPEGEERERESDCSSQPQPKGHHCTDAPETDKSAPSARLVRRMDSLNEPSGVGWVGAGDIKVENYVGESVI